MGVDRNMSAIKAVFILGVVVAVVVGQDNQITICSYANNTLGTCECGQQLFVSEDCKTGFYCMDHGFPEGTVADGCIKTCRDDEILIVNPANYEWDCVPIAVNENFARICPGKFNIECPGNGEIGACECDGQLWINEDCSEGFYCDSVMDGGGEDITCEEGQRVDVDMVSMEWKCIPDDGNCPGAFHVGCETTYRTPANCVDGASDWAQCDCHGQLSINNDCTKGYFCHDSSSGCGIECGPDEILIINPSTPDYWSCEPRTADLEDICPGYVKTDCDCGQDFCDFDCNECPRQAFISKDCSKARRCIRLGMNPWQELDCPPGEIVDINIHNYEYQCIKDDGRCLDRHFSIGCNPYVPSTPSPSPTTSNADTITICSYANNTLGQCECGKQLFVNNDCTEGFYCMESGFPEGVVADGCVKTCREDEVLIVDAAAYEWECVPKSVSDGLLTLCPGEFKVECPGNGEIGDCECDGQLWINEDCSEGFYCNESFPGGGEDITCPEGQRVDVDMTQLTWSCVEDDGKCIGAFHVGCSSTSPTSTASPEVTTSAATSNILTDLTTFQVLLAATTGAVVLMKSSTMV